MTASILDLSQWYDRGIADGAVYMLVGVDTFGHKNYPVYADSEEAAIEQLKRLRKSSMQGVEEVYDLRRDKLAQMLQRRCWDLPVRD
jgi:hypothetical protein